MLTRAQRRWNQRGADQPAAKRIMAAFVPESCRQQAHRQPSALPAGPCKRNEAMLKTAPIGLQPPSPASHRQGQEPVCEFCGLRAAVVGSTPAPGFKRRRSLRGLMWPLATGGR
jgi:hypothetical protein